MSSAPPKSQAGDTRYVTVPASARRERVDRFLAEEMQASRAEVQRWLRDGRVLLGGRALEASDKAVPGSTLEVHPLPPQPTEAAPDPEVSLHVIYDDPHLLVVNKAAGLVVHPGKGNWTKTMVNGLLALPGFGAGPTDESDREGLLRPGIVHRIDKDTSGLLVVAKDSATRSGLMQQFAAHTVKRSYLALCWGIPRAGRIETLYGRHPQQRLKFSSRVSSGKQAVTDVEVIERFGDFAALLRCRLSTGRTHQIRVHLSEQLKRPILADALYGAARHPLVSPIVAELGRQALHAAELGFLHPISGQALHFTVPPPDDLSRAIERLRAFGTTAR
jgi:23S rRNA pseudouridine1911/1915/1917 synthase